jgi:hypothetical protein
MPDSIRTSQDSIHEGERWTTVPAAAARLLLCVELLDRARKTLEEFPLCSVNRLFILKLQLVHGHQLFGTET